MMAPDIDPRDAGSRGARSNFVAVMVLLGGPYLMATVRGRAQGAQQRAAHVER